MYQQTLYKVVKPIKSNTINRLNKSKKWEYGYNKENDIVARLTASADDIKENPERRFLR